MQASPRNRIRTMNLRKRSSENMALPSGSSPEDTPERRSRDAKCIKYSWFLLPLLLGGLLVLALHPTWVVNPVSFGSARVIGGCLWHGRVGGGAADPMRAARGRWAHRCGYQRWGAPSRSDRHGCHACQKGHFWVGLSFVRHPVSGQLLSVNAKDDDRLTIS